jgi:hypothetical protein
MGEFNKDSTIPSGYQILDQLRLSVFSLLATPKGLDPSPSLPWAGLDSSLGSE